MWAATGERVLELPFFMIVNLICDFTFNFLYLTVMRRCHMSPKTNGCTEWWWSTRLWLVEVLQLSGSTWIDHTAVDLDMQGPNDFLDNRTYNIAFFMCLIFWPFLTSAQVLLDKIVFVPVITCKLVWSLDPSSLFLLFGFST